MATNQRNKQKRLEQKRAKRKAAQKRQSQGSTLASPHNLSAVSKAPIHECWMSDAIFESGMGPVVISRRLPNGDIAFGVFLLDIFCLGVKDCFLSIKPEFEYDEFCRKSERQYVIENIHQTCARKIIEGAVDYAKNLGFKPHKDFKRDKLILGDIDQTMCPSSYEYGKDGKPFYISGPNDSRARQRTIMNQLDKLLGSDNYHFMTGDAPTEEIDQKNVKLSSYTITTEPTTDKYSSRITADIKKKISELHGMTLEKPDQAIPLLVELVEKHPEIVQFRNYLASAYGAMGDEKNAKKVVLELYQDEPDYLFGKINYADYCLQDGDLEGFNGIFDGKYDLQLLYPDRDEFHISEAMSFFRLMCSYFLQKGDDERAKTYVNMMEDINPDHPETKVMQEALASADSNSTGVDGVDEHQVEKQGFMKSAMQKVFRRKSS
jgi:hypothetical protein